jgi:hypothetical protein
VAQVKASFPPVRALTCPLPVSCCGLNFLSGQRAGGASRAGAGYWRQPGPCFPLPQS